MFTECVNSKFLTQMSTTNNLTRPECALESGSPLVDRVEGSAQLLRQILLIYAS